MDYEEEEESVDGSRDVGMMRVNPQMGSTNVAVALTTSPVSLYCDLLLLLL